MLWMPKCGFKSGLIFRHPSMAIPHKLCLCSACQLIPLTMLQFLHSQLLWRWTVLIALPWQSALSKWEQVDRWLVDISSIDTIYCPADFTVYYYYLLIYFYLVCMAPRTRFTGFFYYHLKKFVHPFHSQLLIPTHPAKVFHPLSCAGCQVNTLCGCALSGGGSRSCSEGRRSKSLNVISLIAFFPNLLQVVLKM